MSRFGQFPEVFEHVNPEFYPLAYHFEHRAFTVAGETLELADPDLHTRLLVPAGAAVSATELLEVPVALDTFSHPVTTPKLFDWLTQPQTPEHFQQTANVMRDAFSRLEKIQLEEGHHKEMNEMGFSCHLLRKGHVSLSVLGSCACLGTNPDGHLVDHHDWDTGFAELTFHNIDMPAQYVSLLAGLGHLATLCSVEAEDRNHGSPIAFTVMPKRD